MAGTAGMDSVLGWARGPLPVGFCSVAGGAACAVCPYLCMVAEGCVARTKSKAQLLLANRVPSDHPQ